ncbi:hypothetical protein AB0O76_40490 [Streptomyces sp. NPDC086554]|uniref:hypothetical protein n=1 Tax=Streptomyces sp. NPDC086554 TaxID=3154864 RepID=UPI003439306C
MAVTDYGKVVCNGCRMDLLAYPSDYEDGGETVYCGHCEWEEHVCPVEGSVASKILRDAIQRIKWHEFEWRVKGNGADSLDLLKTLRGEFEAAHAHPGMNPYTVVMDWESDWWESGADDVRDYGQDEPVTFYVWSANACDASDDARQKAEEIFKDAAPYLGHVAVLHGHAALVRDGE